MLEAAEDGQTEACDALLQQGCAVNFATKNGATALHKVCDRRSLLF